MKWTTALFLLSGSAASLADGFQGVLQPHLRQSGPMGLRMLNDKYEKPLFQTEDEAADAGATNPSSDDEMPASASKAWFASEMEPAAAAAAPPPPLAKEEVEDPLKTAFFASELEPIVPPDQEPITDFMGSVTPLVEPYDSSLSTETTVDEPKVTDDSVKEKETLVSNPEEASEDTPQSSSTTLSDDDDDEEDPATTAIATTETATGETPNDDKQQKEEEEQQPADDMSLSEILKVASEMEELTKNTPPPPVRKAIEFTNSIVPTPPKKPRVKTEDDIKIETFVQALGAATVDGTKGLFSGILGGLRMTAADALTKSLPQQERTKLLERMESTKPTAASKEDDDDEEEEEEEERGSVAEEIAVAEAEQARLDEEEWEAEKEALVQQMEEAANARVESELAIQKERLEREMKDLETGMEASKQKLEQEKKELEEKLAADSEEKLAADSEMTGIVDMGKEELVKLTEILDKREKQKQDLVKVEDELKLRVKEIEKQKEVIAKGEEELKEKVEGEGVPHLSPKEYRSLSQEEKKALKELRGDKPKQEVEGHPVLGPLVADLGYKRIYLTSSGALGTLPIWKKQRIYRHSRARSMAMEKIKSMETGFPGAVCLTEDGEGKLAVLDGQHRVGMMQLLRAMRNENGTVPAKTDSYFDQVLVEVYPNSDSESQDDEKHAEAVFLEINKAEPVKLVDMPGVASVRDNKLITSAVSRMQEQFPSMFSPSQNCRVPNVNVDNMRNNIFGASIIKRHKLRSSKQLLDWLLVQNAAVGASYECDEEKRGTVSESAWKKATENTFYLGLESSWLYQ